MKLTLAAGAYAHLARVAGKGDDGLEIERETLEPGKIFPRMLRDAAWDVAEMSLATLYILANRADARFIALPVFPSRMFRHSALYVPASASVRAPRDLRDARVGILRYAMTTGVWVRDLLAGQYDIAASKLRWIVAEDSPHPASIEPRIVGSAAALERMAVAGEIDCLVSGHTPAAFDDGSLRRLFPDFGGEEKAYYAKTRVFPIMHVIVAKRALVAQGTSIVAALMRRFETAKEAAIAEFHNFDVSLHPIPWMASYFEDARKRVDGDLWPYGLEKNRPTLEAFGRALHAEGLTGRVLSPEEVFTHV